MGKLRSWRSNNPNNYFAPRFSVDMWFDLIDVDLIDILLREVKKNEYLYEGDRWEHYNIFTWKSDAIDQLRDIIINCHLEFCKELNIEPESLWVRGWVYPQKEGMHLKRHFHAIHENSYLSGNLCLTENKTTTDYDIPYLGMISVNNLKGMLTLFPSSLPHSVDMLKDKERYSLAFDLITEQGMKYFWNNNDNESDPLLLAVKL